MRKVVTFIVALCLFALATPAAQRGHGKSKPKPATVCGDPTATCRTTATFQPYNVEFMLPSNAVIYETELFYAVMLRSVRDETNGSDCNIFVPEAERLAAQSLFPHNKVFASRCYEAGDLYYTNVAENQQFMAVYAGRTRSQASMLLARVKATGKFPDANIRQMRAGFNGT